MAYNTDINFEVKSDFAPKGDQPKAIKELTNNIKAGIKEQVLLGATGTGKTFTVANVIQNVKKPTLILAHNKTLAAQLYSEFKAIFPKNKVEYYISNFDYYKPEAYMPATDTYIDKTSKTNLDIEMLRLSALNSLQTRQDTIVIASVAAIYGLSDPSIYKEMTWTVRVGETLEKNELMRFLVSRGYQRNDLSNDRGTFRAKGDVIEISPGWTDEYFIRIELFGDEIERIYNVNTIAGEVLETFQFAAIFPADGYVMPRERMDEAIRRIEIELADRLKYFASNNLLLEKQRLEQRCSHDIEALREFGMCPGIENYSRHIDQRNEGEAPWCLLDYFPKDFLVIVDESHQMLPQVRGMFNGDRARKNTLVDYGFRLPSALDNRPLKFDEFQSKLNTAIYVSATPGDYELDRTMGVITEQIIRPTGLIDPLITVKKTEGQIDDLISQIHIRKDKKQRTMITTVTKKMAEDLSEYLADKGIKVTYLHSEIKTFERTEIINDLRRGKYDVLVGINLLREGLDIPEVGLVAILDADKEGFLRSDKSLIQIVGRAARNAEGEVIMYANTMTDSMKRAIEETNRRRDVQIKYNEEHGIIPKTIIKDIRENINPREAQEVAQMFASKKRLTKLERQQKINDLRTEMKAAAKDLDFERAATLRDIIIELEGL